MKRILLTLALLATLAAAALAQNTVTTNPLITGMEGIQKAGTSTETYRSSGMFDRGRSTTDNATINTWNVHTINVPAGMLAAVGDTVQAEFRLLGANNVNTHEYQAYFSNSTATCGGTGANLCNAGCFMLPAITNTIAFATELLTIEVQKTGSNTQDAARFVVGSNQAWAVNTCTITDTADAKFVFGSRNTSASAASLAQVWWYAVYRPAS